LALKGLMNVNKRQQANDAIFVFFNIWDSFRCNILVQFYSLFFILYQTIQRLLWLI